MKRFILIALLILAIAAPAMAESDLVYRTEDVELHMPASWADKVLILPTLNGATFYQKASYDKYLEESGIVGGGFLFTLGGCVDSDFQDLPRTIYLGFCEDSAMNYYMELPTDYPAYMEDEEIRAEWDDMHKMMRAIAQGAVIGGNGQVERTDIYEPAPPEVFTSGDYDYTLDGDAAVIVEYKGSEAVVEIPSELDGHPVTEVGSQAFDYVKITSVSFPDSLLTIGPRAFEYCKMLEMPDLPENVTISVDAFAYAYLPSLLVIPAGATVEKGAFSYCDTLERVVIETGATIKSRAFGYCDRLEQAVCADGTRLEKDAFEYCRGMKQAVLCGEAEVDEDAFNHCGTLEVTTVETGEFEALRQTAVEESADD